MDPLSITTAVVGLLKVLPPIALALKGFISAVKDAPHQAQVVLQEATDIEMILAQLQTFLLRRNAAVHERSIYISVEQVLLTLTGTVLSFSELQEILSEIKTSDDQGFFDRMRWMWKEKEIGKIVLRLQNHKASLACMLHIMNSQTLDTVNDSVATLKNLMEAVLASNDDLVRRMESLEHEQPIHPVQTRTTVAPSAMSRRSNRFSISSLSREMFRFAFEHDLQASRVYRRISFRSSQLSLPTVDAPSVSWSMLSGLSMSQISNISVLALPLTPDELSNGEQYKPPENIYAVVKYQFIAEREDELSCTSGEVLVVSATCIHEIHGEWVVAKPLGRLGGPGLVPLEYLEVRRVVSGNVVSDALKALQAAGVPDVVQWKMEASEYRKRTMTLDWEETHFLKIDRDNAQGEKKDK